jgi:hypothetical protein
VSGRVLTDAGLGLDVAFDAWFGRPTVWLTPNDHDLGNVARVLLVQ